VNEYNSDNSRDELRERFRQELKRPLAERFYSEDELIAIFDSATDTYDDYIRAEVLFIGARLYPDSQKLLERRAIFYQDFTFEIYDNFVADHDDIPGTMGELLRLSVLKVPDDEFIVQIEKFLNNYNLDEDEDVIQFIRILHDRQLDNWIFDHLDLIKSKVSYLPTLYYEVAVIAEMSPRPDIAIHALEELTNQEPYNADYWTMLASVHITNEQLDEAKQDIEYALAINPKHYEALKAKLHTISNDDVATFNETFDSLLAINPADAEVALSAIIYAEEHNDDSHIASILAQVMPNCPDSCPIIAKAIVHDYPDLETVLNKFYSYGMGQNSDDWKNLADVAYAEGRAEAVATIFQVYQQKAGHPLGHDFLLMRVLYDMKHYDVAVNMFMNADETGTMRRIENLYKCFALFIMSLLRMGNIDDAVEAGKNMIDLLSSNDMIPGSAIEKYGMVSFLNDVLKRARSKKPTDWATYDPLGFDNHATE
jgi:tetratricopeptide (TPR) repeat protein